MCGSTEEAKGRGCKQKAEKEWLKIHGSLTCFLFVTDAQCIRCCWTFSESLVWFVEKKRRSSLSLLEALKQRVTARKIGWRSLQRKEVERKKCLRMLDKPMPKCVMWRLNASAKRMDTAAD
jgi:hypothetical protein